MLDAPLSEPALRERMEARVAKRLVPLLAALAVAFAFFAGVTLVFQPAGETVALALIDAAGALLMGGAALWIRAADAKPRRANGVAAAALLLTLAASLAAIKLLHLPQQTTNVLLVQLVGSVLLLDPLWTSLVIGASILGWVAVAASEGFAAEWVNAGFALVATSVMSVMIQVVRYREARQTEQLAALHEGKATQLEREVRAERAHARELATANDSLEAFSYVVSHDLKEPIRALHFFLDEARTSSDIDERNEMVDRARARLDELDRLVKGLLEWSRVSTGPLDPEPIDINELLNDPATRTVFDRLLQEKRAKLLIGHDMPQVLATQPLLRQVLGNLILNAIRHNDRADAQVRVYAASDAPSGFVDVVVEDNGAGFPQVVLERFAKGGDEPRTLKGGFGLLIAFRATKRLGGRLHLANRETAPGASVHVLLPDARRATGLQQRVRELV